MSRRPLNALRRDTRCGPIEVQQAGEGLPMLMVHGSGGGHDHTERVSALVLVVPIAWKPGDVADSAPPLSDAKDDWLLRLLGSDFLYWSALQLARDQVFRHVMATPPQLIHAASAMEQARAHAIAERVLPVSMRAHGLRDDTRLGKGLRPAALEKIRAPTLAVSARDDAFGTYAGAQYTSSRIPGAEFLGFDSGGHLLVGHDARVQAEVLKLLVRASRP